MKRFLGLYRWAMQMKLRMGIYTLALLLCKMAWNAIQGVNYVLSLEIVGMWIACLIFAMVETVLLPQGKEPTPVRTVAWVLVGNVIFWGGSLWLGWFVGVPFWGGVALVLLLQAGLAAMWPCAPTAPSSTASCAPSSAGRSRRRPARTRRNGIAIPFRCPPIG